MKLPFMCAFNDILGQDVRAIANTAAFVLTVTVMGITKPIYKVRI